MIIYVAVAHKDDNDADYFQFGSLFSAICYLIKNDEQEFIIRTSPELPADDYTFME